MATATEEPPPTSAMCCVPKLWCERQAAPRYVWRDDGQGGRPGSLWATRGMDLMMCVQGHELPEDDEGGSWCLKDSRITTETVMQTWLAL
mmetsp:Transcript_39148/g.103933  ORF Transcript_39148/g.103933 Transcript_39148/m.103933 type:complete len:90 (+) Transcript_39148:1-270(+)